MESTSYLAWFIATAAMTNVVIYGGIALAYFRSTSEPAPDASPN